MKNYKVLIHNSNEQTTVTVKANNCWHAIAIAKIIAKKLAFVPTGYATQQLI